MSRYRIIKYTNKFRKSFKVQKRSFIGIWYNFNNIDSITTGFYDTEAMAMRAIELHRAKTVVKIINI